MYAKVEKISQKRCILIKQSPFFDTFHADLDTFLADFECK
jgi:hypothetical protein